MDVIVHIPDDLASRFSAAASDLSRRALELLALEEYKSGHITKAVLRRLLGVTSRYELDGFLKAHEVWIDYTVEDFRRDAHHMIHLSPPPGVTRAHSCAPYGVLYRGKMRAA